MPRMPMHTLAGLGLLYEKEHLPGKAAEEFQHYLDTTKEAPDEPQIRHRLEISPNRKRRLIRPRASS